MWYVKKCFIFFLLYTSDKYPPPQTQNAIGEIRRILFRTVLVYPYEYELVKVFSIVCLLCFPLTSFKVFKHTTVVNFKPYTRIYASESNVFCSVEQKNVSILNCIRFYTVFVKAVITVKANYYIIIRVYNVFKYVFIFPLFYITFM